jgi:hypothetical protein
VSVFACAIAPLLIIDFMRIQYVFSDELGQPETHELGGIPGTRGVTTYRLSALQNFMN